MYIKKVCPTNAKWTEESNSICVKAFFIYLVFGRLVSFNTM